MDVSVFFQDILPRANAAPRVTPCSLAVAMRAERDKQSGAGQATRLTYTQMGSGAFPVGSMERSVVAREAGEARDGRGDSIGDGRGPREETKDEDVERVWADVQTMCALSAEEEPLLLGPYLASHVLASHSLADAVARILAHKAAAAPGPFLGAHDALYALFSSLLQPDLYPNKRQIITPWQPLEPIFAADIEAVEQRDPACKRCGGTAMLFFKGFHALSLHRFAHVLLFHLGRRPLALALQSVGAAMFGVDIHPAARIGRGVLLDHATGVVIGETAVIGDGCTLMHSVTLGGNGKDMGDRHPKVGAGVFIGAGAKIFGRVHVGDYAKIAGGSVVLRDVPPRSTAAGVPARIVGRPLDERPAQAMNNAIEGNANI